MITFKHGQQHFVTANMAAATEAIRFHAARPDLALQGPATVQLLRRDQINVSCIRLRPLLCFASGEMFMQIEVDMSPVDA